MLDIKYLTENLEEAKRRLASRNFGPAKLIALSEAYEKKRETQGVADKMRAERKSISKEIGALKSQGKDASEVMGKVAKLKEELEKLETTEKELDSEIREILLSIPNLPAADTPVGKNESDNVEIKKWGEPRKFDFTPKDHADLGSDLDILDFERGAKITGSGFILSRGAGARLERALISFMLDMHVKSGYREMFVPFMVNSDSLTGTGQLPKFEEDLYHIEGENFYMNPTAEVPLTNMYRDEVLSESDFPVWVTAYAPSFRKEAGSYGKDTRGMIRVHQFNKVELVKFSLPENSEAEHTQMMEQAESILQALNLPYRVMTLCTGDTGFSAAKTYDLEVWLPAQNSYREISSVSNCRDFQSRRANIRVKRSDTKKNEFVHTLNGSGLAVGRTVVAILENYQNDDGSITVPEVLVPYMGGLTKIEAEN